MNTDTDRLDIAELCRVSRAWPTPEEVADEYDVPARFVRAAIERGEVATIKIDRIRVDPDSWTRWLVSRYRPAR